LHYTGSSLDGLVEPGHGRLWLNPPYGRIIGDWVRKAVSEYRSGNVTEMILLVPARVDTRWFRALLAGVICFVFGRLKFGGQSGPAPFPSALIYFGSRTSKFVEVFGDAGWIAEAA
jgi:hypothetical protein